MADWFKFYENDLEEVRLQYAISKLPEVVSVWVAILSECCRHKVGTISWGESEIELFGYSKKLNIPIPKVTEAISLLVSIRYIEKNNNSVKVLKWNDKQSEYCQKKAAKLSNTTNSVPTVSRHSTVRGEERRGEEKIKEKKESASRFTQPDMPTIKLQAAKIGLSDLEAEKFFNYYASNGWRVGKNPMKSWTHALSTWKINAQTYGNNGKNTLRDNPRNNGMSETAAKKSAETVEFMRRQNERKTNEPLPK